MHEEGPDFESRKPDGRTQEKNLQRVEEKSPDKL